MYKVYSLQYISIDTIFAASISERRESPPSSSVQITVTVLKQSSLLFTAKGSQKSEICVVQLDGGINRGN